MTAFSEQRTISNFDISYLNKLYICALQVILNIIANASNPYHLARIISFIFPGTREEYFKNYENEENEKENCAIKNNDLITETQLVQSNERKLEATNDVTNNVATEMINFDVLQKPISLFDENTKPRKREKEPPRRLSLQNTSKISTALGNDFFYRVSNYRFG